MPFNSEQLAYAGRAAIDYYLKNDPIDNININRPLIEKLIAGKTEYGGGLQYVVEQLRYSNDSNFQSYFGDSQVSYNRKRTLQQAKYTWGAFHDGFGLNEDELTQNGIVMTDDRSATPSDAEKVQLTNLLSENMETLKLGFAENFDYMLHRDGSQSATDIPGLDALVSITPTHGIVGGIDPSVNTWWQNYADLTVGSTSTDMLESMEKAWRACIRVGGQAPDFLLVGSDLPRCGRLTGRRDSASGVPRRQDGQQTGDHIGRRRWRRRQHRPLFQGRRVQVGSGYGCPRHHRQFLSPVVQSLVYAE